MKSIKSFVYAILGMTSLAATLSSCQDEEFGYTAEDVKKGAFGRNFENEYGKIDPDQSWDLTRSMVRTSKYKPFSFGDTQTRSAIVGYEEADASQIATYPGNAAASDFSGWYDVQDETLTWFNQKLIEGKNHTDLGEPFSLVAPANGFAIIPIFQGEAGMDWQLHVVDKTAQKDYTIWSESQGMVRRENNDQEWSTIPTACHYNEGGLIKDQSSATFGYKIKSQPIQLNIPPGDELFLYLKVVKGQWKSDGYGDGDYAKTGTEQRSDAGMMLALECPIPSNIGQTDSKDNLAMIIGCEDADGSSSDWDMNDVCFLVVGYPLIPDRISYTQKRYMCEDLGNTYDFDFNDIVVDVTEATYYSAVDTKSTDGNNYVNFQKNTAKTKQYATIAHVCGTLPFQVKVGGFNFGVVEDPTDIQRTISDLSGSTRAENASEGSSVTAGTIGWNPNVTKEITGWDPAENNIVINVAKESGNDNVEVFKNALLSDGSVEEENASEHIYRISFPDKGKAPLIIAVDPTIAWMGEHVHIPESWWKEGKVFEENAGSGEHSQHGSDLLSMEITSLPWDDVRQLSYGEGIANNMILMPTCFNTMQVGDVISFTTTGDLNLHIANPAGWVSITSGKVYAAGSNNEPGVVTLKIADATMLQNLKQYGLGINGDKVIVTHIESYTPAIYSITAIAGNGGTVTGSGSYDEGSTIQLQANANIGYKFDHWTLPDNGTSNENPLSIKVSESTAGEYSATFAVAEVYNVNIVAGKGGNVSVSPEPNAPNGKYYEGTSITIKATPSDGYLFDKWSDGNTNAERTIVLDSDNFNLTALFKFNGYIVTITCDPAEGGTITYNQSDKLIDSSNENGVYTLYFSSSLQSGLEITPVAKPNYTYDGWTGDGQCNGDADIVRHFYSLNNEMSATVKFKSTGGGSTGGGSTGGGDSTGTSVTLTASDLAALNYEITQYVTPGEKYDFAITTAEAYKWVKVKSDIGGNETGGQASSAGGTFTLTMTIFENATSVLLENGEAVSKLVISPAN